MKKAGLRGRLAGLAAAVAAGRQGWRLAAPAGGAGALER
jgi:hypothetical protein